MSPPGNSFAAGFVGFLASTLLHEGTHLFGTLHDVVCSSGVSFKAASCAPCPAVEVRCAEPSPAPPVPPAAAADGLAASSASGLSGLALVSGIAWVLLAAALCLLSLCSSRILGFLLPARPAPSSPAGAGTLERVPDGPRRPPLRFDGAAGAAGGRLS
jgi:hypothetical protein